MEEKDKEVQGAVAVERDGVSLQTNVN